MVTRRIENLKILPRLHERVQAKAPPTSRAHRRTAPCTCISDFQSCSEVRLSGATNQAKSCHITWAERASKRDPSTPRWTGPVRVQRIFHRHPVYSATAFAAADVDADADAAAAGCPALLNRNPTKLRTTRSSGTCLHLCFAEFPRDAFGSCKKCISCSCCCCRSCHYSCMHRSDLRRSLSVRVMSAWYDLAAFQTIFNAWLVKSSVVSAVE